MTIMEIFQRQGSTTDFENDLDWNYWHGWWRWLSGHHDPPVNFRASPEALAAIEMGYEDAKGEDEDLLSLYGD